MPAALPERLERDVRVLAERYEGRDGENRAVLNASGDWIAGRLSSMGYAVDREPVPTRGEPEAFNVIAELGGTTAPDEIVIIGAHYDAEVDTPGADDNASGVAVLLELARRYADDPRERTVRWIAFSNEENSSSRGGMMGSAAHARGCRQRRERIVAMLSLEMLGYYDDASGSQRYPFDRELAARLGLELPDTGDFVGVVGRLADAELVARVAGAMRGAGTIPIAEAALPGFIPDIWRSDHGPFWARGYTAAMITDTSEFRNPHYHGPGDTPGTLDYGRMARAADAVDAAVDALASP